MSAPPSYDKSQAMYPGMELSSLILVYYDPFLSLVPAQLPPAPPQQQGYAAVPQQVVVVASPPLQVGRDPVTLTCPHCQNHVTTRVTMESGSIVWLSAGLACMFTGCCCCIPFCISSLNT